MSTTPATPAAPAAPAHAPSTSQSQSHAVRQPKVCSKHFGCDVHYDANLAECPVCDAENLHTEHMRSNTMTLRIDEQSIPPVLDSIASSLEESVGALVRLSGVAEDLVDLVKRVAASQGIHSTDDPVCPKCSSEMILKERRDGSGKFWSCSTYPKCGGTRQYFEPERKPAKRSAGEDEDLSSEASVVVEF